MAYVATIVIQHIVHLLLNYLSSIHCFHEQIFSNSNFYLVNNDNHKMIIITATHVFDRQDRAGSVNVL